MGKVYLAGGCFWCTEAVFQTLKGVTKVTSGYSGGESKPTYESVSSGATGHAETIEVEFDPNTISLKDIIYVFLKTHDPTTLNKQGADEGTQYRSVIFFQSEDEKKIIESVIKEVQTDYLSPIVTEVTSFKSFYPAEDYHQDYYKNNKSSSYCRLVIDPKISKLKKDFGKFVK